MSKYYHTFPHAVFKCKIPTTINTKKFCVFREQQQPPEVSLKWQNHCEASFFSGFFFRFSFVADDLSVSCSFLIVGWLCFRCFLAKLQSQISQLATVIYGLDLFAALLGSCIFYFHSLFNI